ncbi:MAG TPA: aquaporin [Euzebya sp.]|nr:aquaporin [Euzebya sp.]
METNSTAQKLGSEAVGTGLLVFIGVGSVPATLIVNGTAPFTMSDLGIISLAFATVVIAVVYALGHISGAHINPAVTISLAVTGRFPWREVPGYLGAQVVGAFLGALAIAGVLGAASVELGLGVAAFGGEVGMAQATFAELIGTAILVFVVFGAIDQRAPGGWAGLAIGLAVFAIIIVVAPATSASINPARTVGPMVALQALGGSVAWSQLPAYLIGEFAGGILGALAYLGIARTSSVPEAISVTGEAATLAEGTTV